MNNPWLTVRVVITLLGLLVFYIPIFLFLTYIGIPIVYTLVGTIFLFVGQYLIGKRQAMKSVNARDLDENEQWIQELANEVGQELGVKRVTVLKGDIGGPNAFAVGRKRKGVVVISPDLIEMLSRTELKSVLAHEISHLRSRDVFPLVLGEALGGVIFWTISHFVYAVSGSKTALDISAGVGIVIHMIINGFVYLVSREREYVADSDAKEVMRTGRPLARALRKIQGVNTDTHPPRAVETLCMDSSLKLPWIGRTHPPVRKRIDKLLQSNQNNRVFSGGDK